MNCKGRGRRAGRVLPVFAFLMTGTALSLGLSLNLSGLFITQAHLQTCADAAAFSGAVWQARGLNEIARLNNKVIVRLEETRDALAEDVYEDYDSGASAANGAKRKFETYNTEVLRQQRDTESTAAWQAIETASALTRRNEPRASLTVYSAYERGRLGALEPRTGVTTQFGFYYKVETDSGTMVCYDEGPEVEARVTAKEDPADLIYFCNRVLQPQTDWAFRWKWRGRLGVPNVRAYATAMPNGGALWEEDEEEAEPEYVVKLVRTGEVRPRPGIPDDWGFDW